MQLKGRLGRHGSPMAVSPRSEFGKVEVWGMGADESRPKRGLVRRSHLERCLHSGACCWKGWG